MKTKKVAIVYQILAHYREPIFHLLCKQHDNIEYTLFSDRNNTFNSVKTIDPCKKNLSIEKGGLRWFFLKNIFYRNFLWQKGVLSLSLDKEFDVIIYLGSPYYISTWVGALLARLSGKRILFWGHGFLKEPEGFKGGLKKIFYRLPHGMLLYHKRAKEIFIRNGFLSKNLYVIYNSLDYNLHLDIRSKIGDDDISLCRQKLFKKSNLPIILFIGRLEPQKKLILLLEAVEILRDRGKPCNMLFIGDGPEKKKLEHFVERSKLTDHINMYGSCYDEKQNALLISASDICVSPGEVGLTCMHSMVYGTPVITHDDPNCQMPEYEAITTGYNGAFFRKDDPLSLADVIEKWVSEHPDKKNTLKNCYQVIDDYYNPYYQRKIINDAVVGTPAKP